MPSAPLALRAPGAHGVGEAASGHQDRELVWPLARLRGVARCRRLLDAGADCRQSSV